jgi:predicted HD phosphohydrolase
MTTSETRLDGSRTALATYSPADWSTVRRGVSAFNRDTGTRVLAMLRGLEGIWIGHAVNQLTHAIQTATRAVRANASDEMVLCALCHDIGKFVATVPHAEISAEILRPHVSEAAYRIVLTHQDFQGRYIYELVNRSPDVYRKHAGEAWFNEALRFSDEWDQVAFDPRYDSMPLEEFAPLVVDRFSRVIR